MISPSSATRKSGSSPISLKWFRIRNRLKLSMVVICALCNSADCFWICSLPGSVSSLAVMPAAIRSLISAAAALVNVTISNLSISAGCHLGQLLIPFYPFQVSFLFQLLHTLLHLMIFQQVYLPLMQFL